MHILRQLLALAIINTALSPLAFAQGPRLLSQDAIDYLTTSDFQNHDRAHHSGMQKEIEGVVIDYINPMVERVIGPVDTRYAIVMAGGILSMKFATKEAARHAKRVIEMTVRFGSDAAPFPVGMNDAARRIENQCAKSEKKIVFGRSSYEVEKFRIKGTISCHPSPGWQDAKRDKYNRTLWLDVRNRIYSKISDFHHAADYHLDNSGDLARAWHQELTRTGAIDLHDLLLRKGVQASAIARQQLPSGQGLPPRRRRASAGPQTPETFRSPEIVIIFSKEDVLGAMTPYERELANSLQRDLRRLQNEGRKLRPGSKRRQEVAREFSEKKVEREYILEPYQGIVGKSVHVHDENEDFERSQTVNDIIASTVMQRGMNSTPNAPIKPHWKRKWQPDGGGIDGMDNPPAPGKWESSELPAGQEIGVRLPFGGATAQKIEEIADPLPAGVELAARNRCGNVPGNWSFAILGQPRCGCVSSVFGTAPCRWYPSH